MKTLAIAITTGMLLTSQVVHAEEETCDDRLFTQFLNSEDWNNLKTEMSESNDTEKHMKTFLELIDWECMDS